MRGKWKRKLFHLYLKDIVPFISSRSSMVAPLASKRAGRSSSPVWVVWPRGIGQRWNNVHWIKLAGIFESRSLHKHPSMWPPFISRQSCLLLAAYPYYWRHLLFRRLVWSACSICRSVTLPVCLLPSACHVYLSALPACRPHTALCLHVCPPPAWYACLSATTSWTSNRLGEEY